MKPSAGLQSFLHPRILRRSGSRIEGMVNVGSAMGLSAPVAEGLVIPGPFFTGDAF